MKQLPRLWTTAARQTGRFANASLATATTWCVVERLLIWRARAPLPAPRDLLTHLSFELSTVIVVVVTYALVVALPGAGLMRLFKRLSNAWVHGVILGLVLVAPALAVGRELVAGEWVSQQSWAPMLALAPAPAAVIAALIFAHVWFRAPRARKPIRVALYIAAALGAGLLAVVSARLAPGLFPTFHLAAHLAGLAVLLLVWTPLVGGERPRWVRLVTIAVGLAALVHAATLTMAQRAGLMLGSPSSAYTLRFAQSLGIGAEKSTDLRRFLEQIAAPGRVQEVVEAQAPARLQLPANTNVLFILVDTIRADALPPMRGPDLVHAQAGDTPFLDQWIASSFRFRRSYAQSSMTRRSVPAMFRSIESHEDPLQVGQPLSASITQLGRRSLALVNNYFVEPRTKATSALLDGFDEIAVYERQEMAGQVELGLEMLARNKDTPFFAWFHFYCMHEPGFDGKTLKESEGPWPERYRRSLRWLDGELQRLITGLDALGLAERTVIVLAGDHGEGLGDHGVLMHGPTVFEDQVRTPLVFSIPGHTGREIDALVGNIDILPTLVDLLGGEPSPSHRGHSLVPLLLDDNAPWNYDYFLSNVNGERVGLVTGEQKLIFDIKAQVKMRFDLHEDPHEEVNLFDPDAPLDQDIMQRMVAKFPKLFVDELDDKETLELLYRSVDEFPADGSVESLTHLTKVAALKPTAKLLDGFARIFDTHQSDAARLTILFHLFSRDKQRWGKKLAQRLDKAPAGADRMRFVRALADQGQPSFSPDSVAKALLGAHKAGRHKEFLAYLDLVARWPDKSAKDFAPVWQKLMTSLTATATPPEKEALDLVTYRRVLQCIASTRWRAADDPIAKNIAVLLRASLDHPDPEIVNGTIRALAALKSTESVPDIRARAGHPSIRVRQAVLLAIAQLEGEAALTDIETWGKDPMLTWDAVAVLGRFGAIGLPFLRTVERTNGNRFLRAQARSTIANVEQRQTKHPAAHPAKARPVPPQQ